jgi:hypothetical protein
VENDLGHVIPVSAPVTTNPPNHPLIDLTKAAKIPLHPAAPPGPLIPNLLNPLAIPMLTHLTLHFKLRHMSTKLRGSFGDIARDWWGC